MISKSELVHLAAETIFNKPLVTNVYRSVLVEAIVATALPDWSWCSADYASCDFVHPDGTRLEVKQSAVKQTWISPSSSRPSWDIKPRTGRWENGSTWIGEAGRNADIYVLGLHPVSDDTADHREAGQWRFHVIAVDRLPATHRLSASSACVLSDLVNAEKLRSSVETTRLGRLARRSEDL